MASSDNYDDVEENRRDIFHVLAVDDSNIDRKLLERLLTRSEYQVTCVDSGDKALEYLGLLEYQSSSISSQTQSNSTHQHQVSKVNLIMTDYSMPGITGYDLLKKIKDSSWKDVPVIVMSSENVPSRINMCLEGGAEEFLLKPVKLTDLSKLQSHILKYAITHHDHELDYSLETTTATFIDGDDDIIDSAISKEEVKHITVTTNNDIIDSAMIEEEEKITVMTNNDIISINRDNEKEMITITTKNEININRDGEESENDMNCSNATRKATLTTVLMSSDLSDRRPHVQELPVA